MHLTIKVAERNVAWHVVYGGAMKAGISVINNQWRINVINKWRSNICVRIVIAYRPTSAIGIMALISTKYESHRRKLAKKSVKIIKA